MKRLFYTLGVLTLFLAACSDNNEIAGLGDSYDDFVSAYGEEKNGKDAAVASFQDDYILAMFFEEEFAIFIGLDFEATDNNLRSMGEALESIERFMPDDAVKESEETEDLGDYSRINIRYTSESLASAYEESGLYPLSEDDEPNQFMVTISEAMDADGYITATIVLGHSSS
ncbi:hypothetical protein JOC54_001085 [Alkalihalobacillus xiaoxiensis]|uniref:Uncharacterized protein n=1 Tax=Shouchella xiaoxiensis TaxID=766895 RepID=A0ABS2SQS7_9BACI|nr:hypothetical protein [Shouchella xiaoxiensis]MBM7837854.1 hypothetical protein [Shouchella xiaoxiensis]